MATRPTLDQLSLPEDMRSRFLITRQPDGFLQAVNWAVAEHVKGRQHRIKHCRMVWVPEFGDYANRDEWAQTDRNGKPVAVSTAEAVAQLRLFDPPVTPKPGEQVSDAYELTDTITAELQRDHDQLPDILQQARRAAHYETAVGRQRLGFTTIGELTPIDNHGRPEPGTTITNGALTRALNAIGTQPAKAKPAIVKAETAKLCGKRVHVTSGLLSSGCNSGHWLHLASNSEQIFRPIQGYDIEDSSYHYYGIIHRIGKPWAVFRAGYFARDGTYMLYAHFPIYKDEKALRRKLWRVEDSNLLWDKMDETNKAAIERKQLAYPYQQALLAFEKLKQSNAPHLGTKPIRRSLIGRAVDWAYENLP